MTSLKTSIKTITYLSDIGCLEIQGASLKTSKTVAKLLFVVGALVYLVGLWISCPLLSGKGYFLGVLMTATFGNYAYLRAEKLGQLDDFFTHICQLVALITIGLLFIGVLNAPINTYEMVIYPIAFFVCLFGQMRLFRSA
ncbi:inner membrane protein YiaB [Escherichia coli]|uniref:inner membrane protein YiaB n=13 Tax=Gammaproteobacteria TaxID=1236 RepID=UPI000A47A427|nr:inner membrane protein YiaB [Escherichia coli]